MLGCPSRAHGGPGSKFFRKIFLLRSVHAIFEQRTNKPAMHKYLLMLFALNPLILMCQSNNYFKDARDDTNYRYVVIGSQTWMAENLKFRADSGATCFDANIVNCDTYGVLYNHGAAEKHCPTGWHLPSDEEWMTLEKYVGMSRDEINKAGWRGNSHAAALKARFGWIRDGNGTNTHGFNALPAGVMDGNVRISNLGHITEFWTSSYHPRNKDNMIVRKFRSNDHKIGRNSVPRIQFLSVRCIKDE